MKIKRHNLKVARYFQIVKWKNPSGKWKHFAEVTNYRVLVGHERTERIRHASANFCLSKDHLYIFANEASCSLGRTAGLSEQAQN
jgi:hypothetical protein